jgi:hypothetical protein
LPCCCLPLHPSDPLPRPLARSNKLLGGFRIGEEEEEEEEEEEQAGAASGSAAAEGEEGGSEDEGDGVRRSLRKRRGGRTGSAPAQLDFDPHELPEGFRRALGGAEGCAMGAARQAAGCAIGCC